MSIFSPMLVYCLDLVKDYIGNKYFFGGEMKRLWVAAVAGAGVFISLFIFPFTEAGRYVFTHTVTLAVAGMMIEGKVKTKVVRVVWLYCVFSCIDEVMRIIYKEFIPHEKMIYIIVGISSLVLVVITGHIFNGIRTKYFNRKVIFGIVYVILILICLSIGFSMAAIQFMFEFLPEEMELINLDYVTIITFIALILLVTLILYAQKLFRLLERAAQTERNLKQIQAAYYQSLLDKEEETRRYRHDMNNHLLYLGEIAKSENAKQTVDYTESLQKKWSKLSSNRYETGNMILNILLNHHLAELEDIKISIIGVCKRELWIEDVDLCTIFSNLIQNAAEELGRLEEKEKFFMMEIMQGKENTRITICNSTDLSLKGENEGLRSSKKDREKHGMGLRNVKDTVEKYGGEILWSADGKEFKAIVTMKI